MTTTSTPPTKRTSAGRRVKSKAHPSVRHTRGRIDTQAEEVQQEIGRGCG